MITSYTFGKMEINGCIHTSDLMIFPDGRILENWRRQSGHILTLADLSDLTDQKESKPGQIIVGTGANGRMVPSPDLKTGLAEKNIDIQALDTAAAVALYNRLLSQGQSPAACFHLTC